MTYEIKYRNEDEMKDSGIEWVGKIPEDWEVTRIKRVIKDTSGNGFPNGLQGIDFGDIPFYKVSDINGDTKYVNESANYVSRVQSKKYRWSIIEKNSILTAKIGEALRKNHRKINKSSSIIDNNMLALTVKDKNLEVTQQKMSKLGASLSVKLESGKLFLSIAGSVGKPCITKIKTCIHDGFVYFPDLTTEFIEYLYYVFIGSQCYKGLGKLGTQLNLNRETVVGMNI